ncbi:MAG: DUF4435 domain-containing protein [Gammaproteobacteria bacterium]|nr:DUF4435 domain-containing protein [Gammaproteobacteria bacterium]MBU1476251.1 DUF4435 domain-containing protein [Gammaproteobacteria bacterium]MBU2000745.1 DUF4435 domain-containing protein [Gammaproteobacteria bacterium]MBU2131244.1 DUF4435 domain-containing protein [Gammaproteobacteria bacterium]MBU2188431.1 DUF4435 domain-containing protein [Gammaproteobacteria bacterium]
MPPLRMYTAEENFRRIRRQKRLKFIVVEGCDDVPIYESCLHSLCGKDTDFDIVYSEGKLRIKKFLVSSTAANAMFIIDKDFDDIGVIDERLVSLNRYSIENYFISEDVISFSLQFVLKCKLIDVRNSFSLDEFLGEVSVATTSLLKIIFFYQKRVAPFVDGDEKVSWSDFFISADNDWRLCRGRIEELISLLNPHDASLDEVDHYFKSNFHSSGSIVGDFPGKMLKHSLQRYIKNKIVEIKPAAKGKFSNVEVLRESLAAVMYRSDEIKLVLEPVVNFLNKD